MNRPPPAELLALRLKKLSEAIDAFERTGFATPLRAVETGTAADGDEVARLAAQVERMSGHIAKQISALERLARQRRELLTKVSHDLRTPLASMQGYLELLLLRHGKLEAAEQRNYLETAARQSERLARLVDDVFQLAELEGDDAAPQCEDFALAELVQDVIQKYVPDATRRKIELRMDAGPTDDAAAFAVHADIGLIDRVLANLVDNALRHTPAAGAVTIEVGCDTERARLAVRDTGEGIAAADLPGLFERYYRAERVVGAGSTPHGGLGLAIARRVVQLHGGELRVSSTPGAGTRVSFDLPLARRSMPGGAASASAHDAVMPAAVAAPMGPAESSREAELEQRCAEQRLAIDRSEAARTSAEADLRAIEQRYLLALRGSQDGLWEWDLASDSVHLSPRWKSMLGFESHEIGDDRTGWLGCVHPDDRPALEAALQRNLADASVEPQPFDHEMRLLHKDGSVRHMLSRGVAIRNEAGAPYRMVGLDTDVSRVKRLQTVLDVLADGTAGAYGDAFFPALVRNFARALEVDLAFIAECIDGDDPPLRVRTLACWSSTKGVVDNFEFALAGTPCEEVIQGGRACFHREHLEHLFPRERGYEAYLGMPIVASDGHVLGHLAFFDRSPRGDEMLVDSVYRIFLARAAAEMERARANARGA
jgi:PAS domain S-box-containing protein